MTMPFTDDAAVHGEAMVAAVEARRNAAAGVGDGLIDLPDDCDHCGEARRHLRDDEPCERCGMRPDGAFECDGCGEWIPEGLDMRRGDDGERLCAVCGASCEPA